MEHRPARCEYKRVWSALSITHDQAKLHVIGVTDEDALQATGEETLGFLQESVGIRKDDVVLEIGCGMGRVDRLVAPLPKMDRLRSRREYALASSGTIRGFAWRGAEGDIRL
jgi:hypothetical protein